MGLGVFSFSVSALLLCYAGMAALCLAMDRHHAQVWGRDAAPAMRWGLRSIGCLLLAAAAVPCVYGWGASVGAVVWLGFLSAGALLVVGGLSFAPRWAAVAALAAGLVGSAGLWA
jgi:hypothetical protein